MAGGAELLRLERPISWVSQSGFSSYVKTLATCSIRPDGSSEIFLGTTASAREPGATRRSELLDELVESHCLVPIAVDGVRGDRFVVAEELRLLEQAASELAANMPPGGVPPGVAFLAPLDPFVWDRQLLRPLFGFDYIWEVYVPEKKRRWGYYVLPVLYGDKLVGRIEPRFDRRTGTLRILGVWWEDGFDPLADDEFVGAFAGAVDAHGRFGGVARVAFPRAVRHRPLVAALRARLEVTRER